MTGSPAATQEMADRDGDGRISLAEFAQLGRLRTEVGQLRAELLPGGMPASADDRGDDGGGNDGDESDLSSDDDDYREDDEAGLAIVIDVASHTHATHLHAWHTRQ